MQFESGALVVPTEAQSLADARPLWNRVWSEANDLLAKNAELLERFRAEMETLFRALEGDKTTHSRKPQIGLRLIADGEPAGKVIIMPVWSRYRKVLDCSQVTYRMLEERDVETDKGPGKKWSERIKISPSRGQLKVVAIDNGDVDDVRRILSTLRSFLDDRRAVLARCHDRCAMCNRRLTDELSRSRGIGPECIRKLPWITAVLTQRSIIEPELVAV
jgi:hypothetical protein